LLNLALLPYEIVGAPLGILGRGLRALLLALTEQPVGIRNLLRRTASRSASVVVAVGSRLACRIGRLVQPACRVGKFLPLLSLPLRLAAQLLELSGLLFEFVGEPAKVAAACAGLTAAASLLFSLLNHPAAQLTKPVSRFVNLLRLSLLLLLGALLRLVLIGIAIELQLEQIGQLVRLTAPPAAASTATTTALTDFEFVELLGLLQEAQGLLFGHHRFLGLLARELALGSLHFGGRLRQKGRNLLQVVAGVATKTFLHLADEFLDLLAQLALRETDKDRVFLELRRRSLRPVSLHVERG